MRAPGRKAYVLRDPSAGFARISRGAPVAGVVSGNYVVAERAGQAEAVDADALARAPEPDRVKRLEARVDELGETLARVQARLEALEGHDRARVVEPPPVAEEPGDEPLLEPGPTLGDVLPQVAGIGGRTLLILGGGYLLRDLTERGTFLPATGALFGLVYAGIWLFLAYRQARQEPSVSAAFYGVSFALTAFPLLGEVTVRFEVLSPVSSALAFAAAAAAALFVAWRRKLPLVAWSVLVLMVFTIGGTVLQTGRPMPFVLLGVGLGVALDAVTESRGWAVLRVLAAAVADLAMLLFTFAQMVGGSYRVEATLVQLALFGAYMLFFSLRAQLKKRRLSTFERLQAGAVLVVGYLGAVLLARLAPGAPVITLGVASLAVGAVAYAVAYFLFVVPGRDAVEAWFNTSYALVGVLVGSWLLLAEPGFAWAGIGVLLAVLGARDKHAALPLHAAVCAFAAALGSGLLGTVFSAFWATPRDGIGALDLSCLAALGVALFAFLAPIEARRARSLWASKAARTLALAVSVTGLGCVAMVLLVGPLGGGVGANADVGRVAALRTAILAASALGLAAASRLPRFREAQYLVYPVLGVGAVKLLLQDFPNGRALTLFAALGLFGAASIFAPRLRFRPGPG